jgi:hypothetical protein
MTAAVRFAQPVPGRTALGIQSQMKTIEQAFPLHRLCNKQNSRAFGPAVDTSSLPATASTR